MADGPWTKYQSAPGDDTSAQSGPWAKYSSSPRVAADQPAITSSDAPKAANVAPPEQPSRLERIGRELAAPFLGASQLAAHLLPLPAYHNGQWTTASAAMDDTVRSNEAQISASRGGDKGVNWERMGLDTVNPLNFVGGGAARALGVAERFVAPVAGALAGSEQPVTGDGFVREKAEQIGLGAAGGAVTGSLLPRMSPEARLLVDEGVRLTPGQKAGAMLRRPEEGLKSLPITGHFIRGAEGAAREDFNRAAYNRVLDAIGERYPVAGPVGNEGVDAVRNRLSAAYDRAIQGTTLRVNPANMVPVGLTQADLQDLSNVLGSMTTERRQQFNNIVNQYFSQRVPANGVMTAETFKDVESQLQTEARRFTKSPQADEQHLGEALGETVDLLRQSHMIQNPQKAAELQAANRGYARYATIERGAQQRLGSDGVMTPQDFLGGLKAMDSSVRRNRFSRGVLDMQDLARAGNKVLSSRMADSGTPERQFWKDAAMALTGIGGAHYAGLSSEDIMTALGALSAASVPYMRGAPGRVTANIGTRAAQVIDPAMQALAPGAGAIVAQLGVPPNPQTPPRPAP